MEAPSLPGWLVAVPALHSEVLANQGQFVDQFEMLLENVRPEGRGPLEPEIVRDRDVEVINGNIPKTCLIRARDYKVQCMTKMVCSHGHVLSEVVCTQTIPRKCQPHGSWRRPYIC